MPEQRIAKINSLLKLYFFSESLSLWHWRYHNIIETQAFHNVKRKMVFLVKKE